jgi:hypothetical protein
VVFRVESELNVFDEVVVLDVVEGDDDEDVGEV